MTKIILILMFFSFPSLCYSSDAEAPKDAEIVYISGFEDLPLMEGLSEIEEQNIIFDTVEGRIIQSYVKTDTKKFKEIEAFYDETLKSLGWNEVKKDTYKRDGDTLTLEIVKQKPLTIKFELK